MLTTLFAKGLTNPLNHLKTIKDSNIDLLNELNYLNSEVMYHGKCEFCGIGIKERSSLRRHYKSKHSNKTVECDKCDEKFPANSFLFHHTIDQHILYTTNTSNKLMCFICGEDSSFSKRDALTKHYKTHHYKVTKHPCKVCGFEASTSSNLKAHLQTHDTKKTSTEKLYHCKFENDPENPCNLMTPTKYKSGYARHMLRSHGIETDGFTALKCKYCDFVEYDKLKYGNHIECHINGKIYPCLCPITPDKCDLIKSGKELQKHKAKVHGISVPKKTIAIKIKEKKFVCDISEGKCADEPYKCCSNADLKRHKKFKHDIGVTWFTCDQCPKDSAYKAKTQRNLEVHIAGVHGSEKNFTCDLCPKDTALSSFYASTIKQHKQEVHGIDLVMVKCKHCETNFKRKSHLQQHIQEVHEIGDITLYKCELCKSPTIFKRKGHLKKHNEFVHDIGEFKCDFCLNNRNSHIPYEDTAGKHHICKKCYKKTTGKESRIELIVSDYLDEHFGTEFLMGSDKSLKSMGGSLKYRPDKLYASSDFVLLVEIDENQHKYANGSYDCEERRVSDIYDEFVGKTLVCIRWNPHTYKPPEGEKKALREERINMLMKLMKTLLEHPPKDKMSNFYMYYDADSPRLSKKIPKHLIYKESDVDKFIPLKK